MKNHSNPIASIDKRISTLMELKRKIESEGLNHSHQGKVITLSREFGCAAYPVANALKEKLEELTQKTWTIFTEGEIENTNSESIFSAHLSEDFGEQNRYLKAVIAALLPYWHTEEEYYREVVKTIVAIAHRGNAILVGRGASAITRDLPNCFHFRLIGDRKFRARSYSERHEVTLKEAEKIVVEKEAIRKEFLHRFLGTEFNINNFHLIFNNEKIPTDRIVDTIISFIYELH